MKINGAAIGTFRVINLEESSTTGNSFSNYLIKNMLTRQTQRITTSQTLQIGEVYYENSEGIFKKSPRALDIETFDIFSDELKTALQLIETYGDKLGAEKLCEFTKQLIQLQISQPNNYLSQHKLNLQLIDAIENIEEENTKQRILESNSSKENEAATDITDELIEKTYLKHKKDIINQIKKELEKDTISNKKLVQDKAHGY